MMPIQVTATPSVKLENDRRSAGFASSIWSDRFLGYVSNTMSSEDEMRHMKLMEEVRKMLVAALEKPSKNLDLIDAVHRLGVSRHFEKEIDGLIQKLHKIYEMQDHDHDDLYTTSLLFRLLRQHGHRISCDMFNKFKNDKGNLKESLIQDVRGMLSLYEATHLRVHGEDILDKAFLFTTTHLASMASNSSPPLARPIKHALRQSIHRNIPQVSDIQRWWKDLDFKTKLPLARDRVVECYHWILAMYFEPEYSLGRRITSKVIAITSIIDDIYDVYGKFEELEAFTEAIQRWEITAANQLPEYMKLAFQTLLDIYCEIEEYMAAEGKLNRVHYAREALKKLSRAYFEEAKWFHQKYVSRMEEYMRVALVTCCYFMLATTSCVFMGDVATKEAFDWILNDPKILTAASTVCRLLNDIMSHEFEQKRGHVASSIECYMRQNEATRQEAVDEFYKQVEDAWKDINEECLYPTSVPMPLLMRVVNPTRVTDVRYKDTDGYTFAEIVLKDFIRSLLVDPVPV
ncbi:hypothetical protein SLA2020_396460 [Shorea laevis]